MKKLLILAFIVLTVSAKAQIGDSENFTYRLWGKEKIRIEREDTLLKAVWDENLFSFLKKVDYTYSSGDTIINAYRKGIIWLYFVDGHVVRTQADISKRLYKKANRKFKNYRERNGWYRTPYAWCKVYFDGDAYWFECEKQPFWLQEELVYDRFKYTDNDTTDSKDRD